MFQFLSEDFGSNAAAIPDKLTYFNKHKLPESQKQQQLL